MTTTPLIDVATPKNACVIPRTQQSPADTTSRVGLLDLAVMVSPCWACVSREAGQTDLVTRVGGSVLHPRSEVELSPRRSDAPVWREGQVTLV